MWKFKHKHKWQTIMLLASYNPVCIYSQKGIKLYNITKFCWWWMWTIHYQTIMLGSHHTLFPRRLFFGICNLSVTFLLFIFYYVNFCFWAILDSVQQIIVWLQSKGKLQSYTCKSIPKKAVDTKTKRSQFTCNSMNKLLIEHSRVCTMQYI